MKYLDLNTGIAGAQLGLYGTAHQCVAAQESSREARMIYGRLHRLDYSEIVDVIDATKLPSFDAVFCRLERIAFELSNPNRKAGGDILMELIASRHPRVVVVESSRSFLHSHYGYTMAALLAGLCTLEYTVYWARLNSTWIGLPQDRQHTFVVAIDSAGYGKAIPSAEEIDFFKSMKSALPIVFSQMRRGTLSAVVSERRPRPGLPSPDSATPFSSFGYATTDEYSTFDGKLTTTPSISPALGEVVCPRFKFKEAIIPVRLTSRKGSKCVTCKPRPVSFATGKGISARPLFAVKKAPETQVPDSLFEHANWISHRDQYVVFRLTPDRAVLLSGRELRTAEYLLRSMSCPLALKYKLAAAVVPPRFYSCLLPAIESELALRGIRLSFAEGH